MTVRIAINGRQIRSIDITNQGPVGGAGGNAYDPGDSPGGGGLRRYTWICGDKTGEVLHRRSNGAERLASLVCDSFAEQPCACGHDRTHHISGGHCTIQPYCESGCGEFR